MADETSQAMQGVVSLLLSEDDFLNFSETADNLQNTLDAICEVIECRTNIFMQKKEKHQQILDSQMMKLDNERKQYIKKSEAIMNEMGEAKSRLMQIEHSYFSMRNKLNVEKQTNKDLGERIKQLQLESKQKNVKFYKTLEMFSTVINRYKKYLNMEISLEKENAKIVTITFKETRKDFKGYPFVMLKISDKNEFHIMNLHPSLEEYNDLIKQILQPHEIVLFLDKFRKHFLVSA